MQTLRRQARSYALQLLYQAEVQGPAAPAVPEALWWNSKASRKARAFAAELVEATLANRDALDARLAAALEQWKLSRLPAVVRNVLRLAACELTVIRREPPAAIINEAVELTRAFQDEESVGFVNRVLDTLYRHTERDTAVPPTQVPHLG